MWVVAGTGSNCSAPSCKQITGEVGKVLLGPSPEEEFSNSYFMEVSLVALQDRGEGGQQIFTNLILQNPPDRLLAVAGISCALFPVQENPGRIAIRLEFLWLS